MPPWLFPLRFVPKKNTICRFWFFLKSRKLVLNALWKYDEYWIFLCKHFSFYENVSSASDTLAFFSKWYLMKFLLSKLQACKLKPSSLRVFKTPELTSLADSFLQKQALTGSLQDRCSKQQLKFPARPASLLTRTLPQMFYWLVS